MIPLLRPIFPPLEPVAAMLDSIRNTYQFSNFGCLYWQLEAKLSEIMGGWAIPTTSGTTAIEAALASLDLPWDARVIVPDYTHAGTVLAVLRAGYEPIFQAVHPETWVMSPATVADAFERDLADAAIVVSPFGYFVDTMAWDDLASVFDKKLVFDFAGAWGRFPKTPHPVCYSLHSTKNLGVGEGGIVLWQDPEQAQKCRQLINFDTLPTRLIASTSGFNGKIDELRAAVILAALDPGYQEEIERRTEHKRRVLEFYAANIEESYLPQGKHFPSMCVLGNLPAREIESKAVELGFQAKQYYPLLTRMEGMASIDWLSQSIGDMDRCLALPSDVSLETEAPLIVDRINRIIRKKPYLTSF